MLPFSTDYTMRIKKIKLSICNWLADASRLLFPQICTNCKRRLTKGEIHICTSCLVALPFTKLYGKKGNAIERLFWGKFPIERAHAWIKYQSGADSTQSILVLKYGNRPQVGRFLGELMAEELLHTDFFNDIDAIIPIPLATKRERKRGYNQSMEIAIGVSKITHIPIIKNAILRILHNPTQTQLQKNERIKNVSGIFLLNKPELVRKKHILLIDDVITTGATMTSCAQELCKSEGVKISVLALAISGSINLHYPTKETKPTIPHHLLTY